MKASKPPSPFFSTYVSLAECLMRGRRGEGGSSPRSTHATFPTPNIVRSWMQFLARKKGTGGKRGKGGKGPSRSSHDHYILLLLLLGLLLQLPSPFRLKDSLAQFSQEGGGLLWNDSGLWRPVPPHFPPVLYLLPHSSHRPRPSPQISLSSLPHLSFSNESELSTFPSFISSLAFPPFSDGRRKGVVGLGMASG